MAGTFAYTAGTAVINNILSEEADRIGDDVHGYLLHTSPWIDLSTRGEFKSGMGYRQNTLIYDRSLPQHQADGATGNFDVLGVKFVDMASSALATETRTNGVVVDGVLTGAHVDAQGPTFAPARIDFTKKLREFSPERAVYFGPYLDVTNLQFVTQLEQQLSQMVEILGDSTKWVMENRFRDEYDLTCDTIVPCKVTGTTIYSGVTGTPTGGTSATGVLDLDNPDTRYLATANISNRVLDMVQIRLRLAGANRNAWGMEGGQAIHALVLSSEASYRLTSESGYRDDIRNNAGRVDELLQPLGVNKSFRGFYHIADDLAPRYNYVDSGSADYYAREQPYVFSSGVLVDNSAYFTAQFEAAYVLHKDVCKHLIPAPPSASNGVTFDPIKYTGEFQWLNLKDQTTNPFGTLGRFGGIFATATQPIKVNYGVRIIFDRTSATPAE